MRSVGLFEAKTHFSELCEQVSTRGQEVTVLRRGRPLVKIVPLEDPNAKNSIWSLRDAYDRRHGIQIETFEPPKRQRQTWRDPLE